MLKTPISYYGGKQSLLKEILPRIPKHKIYTEAFFGGGAVFFAKEKVESEIINDVNSMVINFYKVFVMKFDELKLHIESTLFARDIYSIAWDVYRIPQHFSDVVKAWAFYVATNMGFACNVGSWGYDKYGKRCKAFRNKKMRFDVSIAQRLVATEIENRDANFVISSRDSVDAFHYVDPPYIHSDQGMYRGYSEEDFRKLLDTLSQVKGKFLLSSYPSDILNEYIERYGWETLHIEKPLTASKGKNSEKRKRKIEVLTANYSLEINN